MLKNLALLVAVPLALVLLQIAFSLNLDNRIALILAVIPGWGVIHLLHRLEWKRKMRLLGEIQEINPAMPENELSAILLADEKRYRWSWWLGLVLLACGIFVPLAIGIFRSRG